MLRNNQQLTSAGPSNRFLVSVLLLTIEVAFSVSMAVGQTHATVQAEQFEKHVRPVLVRHCYECHSGAATEIKGGLRLDYKQAWINGGDSGTAIVPGNPAASLVVAAVRHQDLEMPPGKKLTESEIHTLEQWIADGAFDPRVESPEASQVADETFEAIYKSRRQWWSLLPIANPQPPHIDSAQGLGTIDRFIAARLNEHQLRFAPQADRRTLARRAYFAIIGLPPTENQLTEFLSDLHPLAWEHLIERLLDSPHFGERWARHWMDVVRYTDTYGYEWDIPAKGAWRYRDYLIRAFNSDISFDQLVREHIAGDLLDTPRTNELLAINESLIGPMFFQMGEKRHGDSAEFNGIHQEMLDNKIDAFGKAFLATTISCARCHDHKLDAISQKDYYALGGLLISSRWVTNTIDLPQRNAMLIEDLNELKRQLLPLMADQWLKDIESISTQSLQQISATNPERALEDPLHAWAQLQTEQAPGKDLESTWMDIAKKYRDENARRKSENDGHFSAVVDFRDGVPSGWSVDGAGLRTIVARGDFVVSLTGDKAIDNVLLGGLCTNSVSPRLNGALRTPWTKLLGSGQLSFEVAGGDFAARRIVVDNAFLTERQQYLNDLRPKWQIVDGLSSQSDRQVYIEFATKSSNPNFPPRVGLGGACSEDQTADPKSWFQLSRVVKHVAPFSPHDELTSLLPLFADVVPKSMDEVVTRYRELLSSAVIAWKNSNPSDDHIHLLNWMLSNGVVTNVATSKIQSLVQRYRGLEAELRDPATVNGMADIDAPIDYPLNIRGDYDRLDAPVSHGPLRLLLDICRDDNDIIHPNNSDIAGQLPHDRLELAELVACSRNPLTARVYVNRVWHWLFGTGLVATTDDFGHVGEQPSHPELLDALASQFIQDGWSTKGLIRQIVLSQTWQQSQDTCDQALQVDPSNRLLHHYPLQRLDAESLRDSILSVSGRLDATMFGPTSDPHRLSEDDQKRLFSGPLDGEGRRSIYTKMTIMEPPRFLATFNQPAPKIPTGRRDSTNTPAQSLALLNDPLVRELSRVWAAQLVSREDLSIERRLQHMFLQAIGRNASESELSKWESAVRDFAADEQIGEREILSDGSLWQTMAHAMFNIKEFLYVR